MRLERLAVLAAAGLLALGCRTPQPDTSDGTGIDTPGAAAGVVVGQPGGTASGDGGSPPLRQSPGDDVRQPPAPPQSPAQQLPARQPSAEGRQPPAGQSPQGVALSGNRAQDERAIRRLEEEVRRLARQDGCEREGQCAAAPVGAKACGGPRSYVTYCTVTTDVPALRAKIDELHRFEQSYNQRYEIVSDCMLVMEPPVALSGGRCVARQ